MISKGCRCRMWLWNSWLFKETLRCSSYSLRWLSKMRKRKIYRMLIESMASKQLIYLRTIPSSSMIFCRSWPRLGCNATSSSLRIGPWSPLILSRPELWSRSLTPMTSLTKLKYCKRIWGQRKTKFWNTSCNKRIRWKTLKDNRSIWWGSSKRIEISKWKWRTWRFRESKLSIYWTVLHQFSMILEGTIPQKSQC